MKTILNSAGADVTATTVATLKTTLNIQVADLYHLVMLTGAQSRVNNGFVARWTDRDYPIKSTLLNSLSPPNVISWPPPIPSGASGIFYPQRMKRGGITSQVGLQVANLDVEVFSNDNLTSVIAGPGGFPQSPTLHDLSVPVYRDAFTLSANDFLTVAETLKQAAWRGDLDGVYLFVFRGFMAADNGNVDTLGIMQLFTGYMKEVSVSRLSVKMQFAALLDLISTTYTPTQVIANHDRGGDDIVTLATSFLSSHVQPGSTSLALIGDGGSPPSLVEVDGEQQLIPGTPFQVSVLNAGPQFVSDLGVVFSSTGIPLVKVGGSPNQGQYAVSATGTYTFNHNDSGQGVSISYTYNAPAAGIFANGILVYQYGTQYLRPKDTFATPGTQRVIREVYTNTFTGGLNQIFLFEPLPIPPTPFNAGTGQGDTFQVYQPQAFDSAQSVHGKGFPFVPKPESAL